MSITTYMGPNAWANVGQTYNMTLQDVLDYGYDIGLDDYPVWSGGDMTDAEKREWLNARIIDHFLMREIRAETPAQFILWVNRIMREQMPMINPLFETAWGVHFTQDNMGYWETVTRTSTSSGTTSGKSSGTESTTGTSTSSGTDTGTETVTASSTDTTKSTGTGTTDTQAYTSTNPRQTMVGKTAANYYDAGTKTTVDSETGTDTTATGSGTTKSTSSATTETEGATTSNGTTTSTTSGTTTGSETATERKSGYDGTVAEWSQIWVRAQNALSRVFDCLEPCFSQLVTDHFNVW